MKSFVFLLFVLSPDSYVSLHGSVLPKGKDLRRLAPSPPDERLSVLLCLRFAETDDTVFTRAREISLRGPAGRGYAGPREFQPPEGVAEMVRRFAARHDLRLSWPAAANGVFALLEGSTTRMNSAFRVELHDYYSPAGDFRGYEGAVSLPRELAEAVRAVFGLARRPSPPDTEVADPGRPSPNPDVHPSPRAGRTVAELSCYYRFPREATGAGQSVAVIGTGGSVDLAQLGMFFEKSGSSPGPQVAHAGSRRRLDGSAGNDLEALRALEVLGALAPGAAFTYYNPEGQVTDDWFAGFLFALAAALFDERSHDLILCLPGLPEYAWSTDEINLASLLFAAGACMGVTVVAPSGDFGAAGFDPGRSATMANVHFPASSPLALACGGSMLWFDSDQSRTPAFETAWNDLARSEKPRATGGGFSRAFARPAYQDHPALVVPGEDVRGRGLPDVAANAAPDSGLRLIREGVEVEQEGGTVLAAAIWSGLILRLNESLGVRVGWLQPLLYRWQLEEGRAICRTLQNRAGTQEWTAAQINCNGPLSSRFTAAFCIAPDSLWSACCGLGTPDGERLLDAFREAR